MLTNWRQYQKSCTSFHAGHVDLYDKTDLIPFDRGLEAYFTENLSNNRFKGSNHHRRSEGTTVSLDWWFRCHR
ncbi:hypothetical protein ABIE66_003125 [Peribacillus sp. B2I2]|uniref:hypothetical protein n=1 Tax=Peribacillus sp. B2I2 TaxID=3156468 RepID=UPI0035166B5B